MMAEVIETLVRYVQNGLTESAQTAEDKTLAISCAALFRPWEPGVYKAGDIRTDGKTPYECILDHDSTVNPDWTIDVRILWKPYHSRQAKWALPFIQPTGAHDAYQAGEYCIWQGKTCRSKVDGNVYSPGDYPENWEEV